VAAQVSRTRGQATVTYFLEELLADD